MSPWCWRSRPTISIGTAATSNTCAKAGSRPTANPDDLLVYDADDADRVNDRVRDTRGYSRIRRRTDAVQYAREVDGQLVDADGTAVAGVAGMRRALVHDRTNALAAAITAIAVGTTTLGSRTLASYATLPHRVALVDEAGGVSWYDDSKATNPDATFRTLESFDSVVLVAGGRNKGLDLGVLATAAERYAVSSVR